MRAFLSLCAVMLFASATLATVPTDLADKDAAWWRHFNEQVALSLDSDISDIRRQALATVAYVAERYPERLDGEQLLKPLARVYRLEADVELQKQALLAFTRLRAAQYR